MLGAPLPRVSSLRFTLIDAYLLRTVAGYAGAFGAMIFLGLMLERALRIVNQMAALGAHMGFLPGILLGLVPYYLGMAIPTAFMIGLLMAFSRLDEDLEIEVMLTSGLSFARLMAPLVAMGALVAAASLLIGATAEPLGHYAYRAERAAAVEAGWTAQLRAGAFLGRPDQAVITADGADASGRLLTAPFIALRGATGSETVFTATTGVLGLWWDGRTTLVDLRRGVILYEHRGRRPLVGMFDAYSSRIPLPEPPPTPPRGLLPREWTTPELLSGVTAPGLQAELLGRISRALAMPLMPLLAFPLAVGAGRGRKGPGRAIAVVILLLFHEAVRLAQNLAAQGRIDPVLGVGGLFLAFSLMLIAFFSANRRLRGDQGLVRMMAHAGEALGRLRPARPRRPKSGGAPRSAGTYVAMTFAGSTLVALAGLMALVGGIDLFERTDDILDAGEGYLALLRYAGLRAPVIAEQAAGLATLAGATFAFLGLARRGEVVALRACGISLYQMLGMTLPVAFAMSLVIAGLAEVAAPRAQVSIAQWGQTTLGLDGGPDARHWFRLGERILTARAGPDPSRLESIAIYTRDDAGRLVSKVAAPRAYEQPWGWRLEDVTVTTLVTLPATGPRRTRLDWHAPLRGADVADMFARPLQIPAMTAWRALTGRAPTDQARAYLVTRLHRALAEPLAPFVMLLIALPLALASIRQGPPRWQLIYVPTFGMLYVVLDGLMTALGQTGLMDPALAAWSVPLSGALIAGAVLVFTEG